MKKITFAALAVPLMWVLLLLLFSNYKVYAQERLVLSGIVKSADGTLLEGVTVWQNDSNKGTQTNEQGFYTLSVIPNATITFEYLGFKTQQLKASTNVLNVTMQTDDDTLEELVINAGYYSVKDKERTGSISKITSKEIGQQPVANPLAAMQGRMAGVNITQSSGTPGGGFDIQIRGRNSLRTEGNAPLYIVDGVPFLSDSQSFSGLSSTILKSTSNTPLEFISPNDIESIEVLKDADATAIYGSRGANGVVLITTKKGSNQAMVFTLQSHTAVGTVPRFMNLLNTADYLDLRKQAFANDGVEQYPANAYDVNGTWNQDRYTNWQKVLIGGKAVSRQISAGLHGGDKQNRYRIHAGTSSDGTVFPGDYGMKRKNMSAQFEHTTVNNKWKFNVQLARAENKNKLLGSDLTSDAIRLVPNAPELYDSTGNLNWENGTWENPLRFTAETYKNNNISWMTILDMEAHLHNNITLHVQSGINESSGSEIRLTPHTFYNPSFSLTSAASTNMFNNYSAMSWNIEPQINYLKVFQNHKIEATFGTTFLKQESIQQIWLASNFPSNSQIENIQAAKNTLLIGNQANLYAYHAVFARFNYQFQDRFIINLTGRRDGSSRFGPERQWGNFGAVGAAWLFGNEKFFENSSWLSFGKLRASFGIAGNDRIGDYQFLDTYGNSGGNYDMGGISPLRAFNPDFGWETGRKKEVALEMSFLNNTLSLSTGYYHNLSSNQLVGMPLPGTTGFTDIQANMPATVRNTGLEIELKARLLQRTDYSWNIAGTVSINRNKLIEFPDLKQSVYQNIYEVGYPTSLVKVYEYIGIDTQTQLYTFKDFNGDGTLTAADDAKLIVDLTPRFFGALQQNFTFKRWSLDVLLYGVKQKGVNYLFTAGMPGSMSNQSAGFADNIIQNPSAGYNAEALNAYNMYTKSQAAYTDASYLRLKNVSLAYHFSELFNTKTSGQLYLMGQNLFTWTAYKGLDPESQSAVSVPPLRVLGIGVSINY